MQLDPPQFKKRIFKYPRKKKDDVLHPINNPMDLGLISFAYLVAFIFYYLFKWAFLPGLLACLILFIVFGNSLFIARKFHYDLQGLDTNLVSTIMKISGLSLPALFLIISYFTPLNYGLSQTWASSTDYYLLIRSLLFVLMIAHWYAIHITIVLIIRALQKAKRLPSISTNFDNKFTRFVSAPFLLISLSLGSYTTYEITLINLISNSISRNVITDDSDETYFWATSKVTGEYFVYNTKAISMVSLDKNAIDLILQLRDKLRKDDLARNKFIFGDEYTESCSFLVKTEGTKEQQISDAILKRIFASLKADQHFKYISKNHLEYIGLTQYLNPPPAIPSSKQSPESPFFTTKVE